MPTLTPSRWQRRIANRSQRSMLAFLKKQDEELQRIIVQAARDADRLILGLPGETVSEVVRRAQYAQRQAALRELAQEMWGQVGTTVTRNSGVASQLAVNANQEILEYLVRSVGPGRAGIMAESMRASARGTFQNVRSRLMNDIDLSPNVFSRAQLMNGTIDRLVNDGIALGKSAREIAGDVVGHINPRVMGGQRYAAMRLGRTELNNAFHTTSVQAYQESPYVLGVKWNLSGSHPRPDECNDYARYRSDRLGEGVFRPDNVPDKPHPQCFCYTTAVTPDPEEMIRDMLNGEFSCGRV